MGLKQLEEKIEKVRIFLNAAAGNSPYAEVLKISQHLDDLINEHYTIKYKLLGLRETKYAQKPGIKE